MGATLVINATGAETRVALVENGTITEYYHERKKDKGIVGNICKGRVVRVLPGMQAAFVDVGLEKAAFLYVSDVFYDPDFSEQQFDLTEGEHEEVEDAFLEESESEEVGEEKASLTSSSGTCANCLPESSVSPPLVEESLRENSHDQLEHGSGEQPVRNISERLQSSTSGIPADFPVLISADKNSDTPTNEFSKPAIEVLPEEGAAENSETKELSGSSAPVEESKTLAESTGEAGIEENESDSSEEEDISHDHEEVSDTVDTPDDAETGSKSEISEKSAAQDNSRGELRNRDRRRRRRGGLARREVRDRGERSGSAGSSSSGSERHERPERLEHENNHGREREPKLRRMANIQDLLKVGQEIIVQIAKDPIGTKGARVTSHISLPGRHLVFMPTVDHVGISRRIERESERRRLREIVDRIRPQGTGFIVRTVAENISTEKLEADAKFLIGIWNAVGVKKEKMGAPALLHPDLDLVLRATRDLFAQDVEKLVIDDRAEWDRVSQFVEAQDPSLKERVVIHDSEEPIFDAYGIEHELQKAQQRKVWLKSGGYLIIDQAEALTAIDVNSGRYVGKKSLEETITKINIEAAREIVYQLRLRNIGGIIIIDFIDMDKSMNREKVFKALQEALGRDKAKTNVLKISELGLVEMTRKRVRESLGRTLNEPCSYCDGRGYLKSKRTVAYEVLREIRREAINYKENVLVINCHPDVGRILQIDERDELRYLMDRYNKSIHIRPQLTYHQEQFDMFGKAERVPRKEREEGERTERTRGDKGERAERNNSNSSNHSKAENKSENKIEETCSETEKRTSSGGEVHEQKERPKRETTSEVVPNHHG